MKSKIDLYKYDSQFRCQVLIAHYQDLPSTSVNNRAFWRDLSEFWHTFDGIDHTAIQELMRNNVFRHAYLSKPCQKAIDELFEANNGLATIYRGQNDNETEIYASGLSWTTDIDVAKKFAADGIRGHTIGKPYLLKTQVNFMDVAMVFNERDESEVVLFELELENLFNKTIRIDL